MLFRSRGDGGFSKHGGGDEAAPAVPAAPDTPPDVVLDLPTRPDAALLYRLSGDINPLHVDPAVAAKAGFPRPILHGLATYGVACHAVVRTLCGYDPTKLKSFRARLTSPVLSARYRRQNSAILACSPGASSSRRNSCKTSALSRARPAQPPTSRPSDSRCSSTNWTARSSAASTRSYTPIRPSMTRSFSGRKR